MTLYRSKPTEIEAVQWLGDSSIDEVQAFGAPIRVEYLPEHDQRVLMLQAGKDGAQGWVEVPVGHWIVRQPDDLSDHWPVEPDYFAKKYSAVLKGSDQHEEFLGRLMGIIREGEALGVVFAGCDTHEGIEWTEAERHDLRTHGIDRCVPAFRVIADEHRRRIGCSDPDAGCAEVE